jgi:hypothetical protein
VPMTTFSTFVTATPSAKVTAVQTYKAGYDLRHDFYKRLREAIPRNHQDANTPDGLSDFLRTVTSDRKIENYAKRVSAYQRWWKGQEIVWRGGRSRVWEAGPLEVSITPELLVDLDGTPHAIKLYLNKDKISTDRANVMLRLLELGYHRGSMEPAVGVLDVARARLLQPARSLTFLDPVLAGEGAAFDTIFDAL